MKIRAQHKIKEDRKTIRPGLRREKLIIATGSLVKSSIKNESRFGSWCFSEVSPDNYGGFRTLS